MLWSFCLLLFFYGCDGQPIDQHATTETKNLFKNLMTISRDSHKIIFGQHQFTQYGVYGGHNGYVLYHHDSNMEGWAYTFRQSRAKQRDDLCDVCSVTHEHPGMMSMDFHSLESHYLESTTYLAHRAYERGEVLMFSWHHDNPVTGGSVYLDKDKGDYLHTIKKILPGGPSHVNLTRDLDKIVAWNQKFLDSSGKHIPIIFRPFHEMSGSFFWWGMHSRAHNTEQEFQQLWRFVVTYLRDTKKVHNFLYCYSPSRTGTDYFATYPGDDYVDILGMDYYRNGRHERTTPDFIATMEKVVEEAEARHKIAALSETGPKKPSLAAQHNVWTDLILNPLKSSKGHKATRIAFINTWKNRCHATDQCDPPYLPYHGHPAEHEFKKFYNDPITVWSNDLPDMYS